MNKDTSKKESENIEVSILCHAYNHESYIRQALDSFLTQKTNFRYEVVVHDDASTDGTAEIIEEYQKQYPNIIVPIIQKENMSSKGISICLKYSMPKAKGKYIAMCDGDDYWIDNGKLQMQYDALEENNKVDICATGCVCLNGDIFEGKVCPSQEDRLFTTDEVIRGDGGFVATASLFFRKESCEKLTYGLDYLMQIYGAIAGGMLYIAKNTCVYRVNVKNSWTQKNERNVQDYCNHLKTLNRCLQQFDEQTNYRFHEAVDEMTTYFAWKSVRLLWNVDEMFDEKYEKYMKGHKKAEFCARVLSHIPNPVRTVLRSILINYEHQ